jgi:hypothetical protein
MERHEAVSRVAVSRGMAVVVRFGLVGSDVVRRSGSGKICLGMESYGGLGTARSSALRQGTARSGGYG